MIMKMCRRCHKLLPYFDRPMPCPYCNWSKFEMKLEEMKAGGIKHG